jgi:putative ABC transport system permease protein
MDINSNNLAETIDFIKNEHSKITGLENTRIRFIDDMFDKSYRADENFATLIGYLTVIAIFIACIGLLGVSSHAIKLRIKEIGIRKTMGASSFQILNLISAPFLKTIIISTIIAVPLGVVAMEHWLTNYPYRVELSWWIFAASCGLTIFIAGFTIIWQSWRASSMNPARLIRYE